MYHYRTAKYETRTLGGVRGALRQLLAEPSTRLPTVLFTSGYFNIQMFTKS